MAKAKPTVSIEDTTPRLTAVEYWEWRATIAEMQTAEANHKLSLAELNLLQKDSEILAVRTQLFHKVRVGGRKEEFDQARLEYDQIKERLETRLGISLNNKAIDDKTFEVRELPKEDEKLAF